MRELSELSESSRFGSICRMCWQNRGSNGQTSLVISGVMWCVESVRCADVTRRVREAVNRGRGLSRNIEAVVIRVRLDRLLSRPMLARFLKDPRLC